MIFFLPFIFCYDVWFYMSHSLLHSPNMYKYHSLHHKSSYRTLTFRDTVVAHDFENIFQLLGILLPFLFCCCYVGIDRTISSFIYSCSFIVIRGYARHDPRTSWLIGNHHILHHKNQKYNFGEYWIDNLMGTRYPYEHEYKYGLIYT